MAIIRERTSKKGEKSYNVIIRKKEFEISKTFSNKEDANLYVYYKENLLSNMKSFEINIEDRVTLKQLFELKMEKETNKRSIMDFENAFNKIKKFINKTFVTELNYEDWIEIAKNVYNDPVYKGGKTEKCKRNMSIASLRRYFAVASSTFSHAISYGINVKNYPLEILQNYINPQLKNSKCEVETLTPAI